MARPNEARTEIRPWLETLAWNAAAVAALGAMLLVLLGSLEWLDHVTPTPAQPRSLPVLAGGEACAPPSSGSG